MTGSHDRETDLRILDRHASWRDVYAALEVETDQHEGRL